MARQPDLRRQAALLRRNRYIGNELRHPFIAAFDVPPVYRLELGLGKRMRRGPFDQCLGPRHQARVFLDEADRLERRATPRLVFRQALRCRLALRLIGKPPAAVLFSHKLIRGSPPTPLWLPQQLRHLSDVRRDPPRFHDIFRPVARIEAVLAQKTRIDMPSINERDAAMARAIFKESEELKDVLEKELRRLENNETFDANEFQKGIVRALIDLFRMVNGLASIAAQ